MASFRPFAWVALAAALAAGTGFAYADPPPWAHGHGHGRPRGQQLVAPAAAPGAHGSISGTIAGIDYGSASILVATPRGVVPVSVTPTTSIFRGPAFASFGDLARGARITVDFSEINGRLVAQIIRIR